MVVRTAVYRLVVIASVVFVGSVTNTAFFKKQAPKSIGLVIIMDQVSHEMLQKVRPFLTAGIKQLFDSV